MDFFKDKNELAPFVNLRSDVGFKAVFADKNNKDILIGVLMVPVSLQSPTISTGASGLPFEYFCTNICPSR